MTNELIGNWNSVVTEEDTVYHLGNFAWDPKTAQDALQRLKGTIKLLPAEHDEAVMLLGSKKMLPTKSSLMNRITPLNDYECNLSYWPMQEWPGSSSGYYSIIGYPGSKYKSNPTKKIINASIDLWGYKPQELTRLLETFNDF
jgi:calcineurin-like phosphoesterase family protein